MDIWTDLDVKAKEDKSLYLWCGNVRSSRKDPGNSKIKLTNDFIASLDALVFNWTTLERKKYV